MQIFKHRTFHKWAQSEGIEDCALRQVVLEMNNGLYEANLGSGLYKKRVAMQGKGKSGGYRTLLALKEHDRAFFIYAFAKNVCTDISDKERHVYRQLARHLLTINVVDLKKMVFAGKLWEVK